LAISGPTYENQKPFDWRDDKDGESHRGEPTVFKFPWVEMSPSYLRDDSRLTIRE